MCPDWGSNLQPFSVGDDTPTYWATWLGLRYELNVVSDYLSLQAQLKSPAFGELLGDHLYPQEFLSHSLMVGTN